MAVKARVVLACCCGYLFKAAPLFSMSRASFCMHLGYSDKLSDTTHSNFIGLTCISDLTSTHRLSFATTFSAHAALPQLSGLLLFHG